LPYSFAGIPAFYSTESFQGIVEMDETYFLDSEKGSIISPNVKHVNEVAKPSIVASIMIKDASWLPMTARN
jgi:hypothetical protein